MSKLPVLFFSAWAVSAGAQEGGDRDQRPIGRVAQMPSLPQPLSVRDWHTVAVDYYRLVLNPGTRLDGRPTVLLDKANGGFLMPAYVDSQPADEGFTALSAVIGATLAGLDARGLHGFDFLRATKQWYDPEYGFYRHSPPTKRKSGPVVHAGIYGYHNAVLGMVLASLYPDDAELRRHAQTTAEAFHTIAKGCGCPEQPDFNVLGFNFQTGKPDGRNEPMNRCGHAPAVAWILLAGASRTDDAGKKDAYIRCAESAMEWYASRPGHYEATFAPGPLTAARLNAEHGCGIDVGRVLQGFFGDGPPALCPWKVSAGQKCGGMDCDGLDGAIWGDNEEGFHAFSMSTLINPAWLLPVARYYPRYADAIGRYALNAANAARLFQGEGLDWEHQDHKDWKDKHDPGNLLFYEALTSWDWGDARSSRPYATGDPVRLGWNGNKKTGPSEYHAEKRRDFSKRASNISLYMGNHVGFLGGIVRKTNVPGILRWDCIKTDFHSRPAYPAFLVYNPHPESREVVFDFSAADADMLSGKVEPGAFDIFDLTARQWLVKKASGKTPVEIPGETSRVIMLIPSDGNVTPTSQ